MTAPATMEKSRCDHLYQQATGSRSIQRSSQLVLGLSSLLTLGLSPTTSNTWPRAGRDLWVALSHEVLRWASHRGHRQEGYGVGAVLGRGPGRGPAVSLTCRSAGPDGRSDDGCSHVLADLHLQQQQHPLHHGRLEAAAASCWRAGAAAGGTVCWVGAGTRQG